MKVKKKNNDIKVEIEDTLQVNDKLKKDKKITKDLRDSIKAKSQLGNKKT